MSAVATLQPQFISIATAAGSGQVNRWTYTVPAGKRAVLTHAEVRVLRNAAAAATTAQATINYSINGIAGIIVFIDGTGAVIDAQLSYSGTLELRGGDTVSGITVNTSGVIVTMQLTALIEEYL